MSIGSNLHAKAPRCYVEMHAREDFVGTFTTWALLQIMEAKVDLLGPLFYGGLVRAAA